MHTMDEQVAGFVRVPFGRPSTDVRMWPQTHCQDIITWLLRERNPDNFLLMNRHAIQLGRFDVLQDLLAAAQERRVTAADFHHGAGQVTTQFDPISEACSLTRLLRWQVHVHKKPDPTKPALGLLSKDVPLPEQSR